MQKLYDILVSRGKDIKFAADYVTDLNVKDGKEVCKTALFDNPDPFGVYFSNGHTACFIITRVEYGEKYSDIAKNRVEYRYSDDGKSIFIPCSKMCDECIEEYTYFTQADRLEVTVIDTVKHLKHDIIVEFKS